MDGFSEEARTRGFASLTLVSFAFINYPVSGKAQTAVNSGMYLNWSWSKKGLVECLLSPKAAIQMAIFEVIRPSAFGHKRTVEVLGDAWV
jgi:hypothetical protein